LITLDAIEVTNVTF